MSQDNGWNSHEVADGDLKLVNGRWVWNDDRPEPRDACGPMTDEEIEQMRMAEAAMEFNRGYDHELYGEDVDPFDD